MKLSSSSLITIGIVVSAEVGKSNATNFLRRGLSTTTTTTDLEAPVQSSVTADSFAITVGASFSGNECPAEAPENKDYCSKYLQQCRYPIIGCANGNEYNSSPSYWICNCDSVNEQFFCSINCEGNNCNEPCSEPPTRPENNGGQKPIRNEAWCSNTYPGNQTQCDYVGVSCEYDASMGVPNMDLVQADDRLNCHCDMKSDKSRSWMCESTSESVDVDTNSLALNNESDTPPTSPDTTTEQQPMNIRSGPLGDAGCPNEPPLSYDTCSNDESQQNWLQCQYLIEGQQYQRWTCNCGTNNQFACSLNGIE